MRFLVATLLLAVGLAPASPPAGPVTPAMAGAGAATPGVAVAVEGRRPGPIQAGRRQAGPLVDDRLRELFVRAESLYRSSEAGLAYLPLSQVIAILEPAAASRELQDEARLMLIRSLVYRADVNLLQGEREAADEDLRRLLELYPRVSLDGFRLTGDVLERFEEVRSDSLAYLELSLSPLETRVRVDGVAVPEGVNVWPVLAGSHVVEAGLPGYTTARQEVEVAPGNRHEVQFRLHRVSAVVRLRTHPAGATVRVDGQPVGTSSGTAESGFTPSGDAARLPAHEFSAEMIIENLMPGQHEIEISKDGYRTRRDSLRLDELADYRVGPIVLTPSTGTLLLRDLPSEAEVWLDGSRVEPEPPSGAAGDVSSSAWRLSVGPGPHRLTVDHGLLGVFEAELSVAEQSTNTVTVRLYPGLTFLGVVGESRLAAGAVGDALDRALAGIPGWNLIGRQQEGRAMLEQAGVTAERLRQTVDDPAGPGAVDWARLQEEAARRLPGSVFVLAVATREDVAAEADLWIWPAPPGPARPERRRIPVADTEALDRLAERISTSVSFEAHVLGTWLVDSSLGRGPVVVSVTPGGPAAAAGVQPGDEIVTVAGNVVGTTANFRAWLTTFSPGASVALGLAGAGGERNVELRLGTGYRVVDPTDPGPLYTVVWAQAAAAAGRLEGSLPSWVAELNQASVLIRATAWEDAVRLLRRIQPPERDGLGQGMVDYWLGLALEKAGRLDAARDAYQRVMSSPGARYLSDDGPPLAPRAAARLAGLGG